MKRFKPLGKVGVVLAVILLILAPANLIIDLGRPLRFWHLFPYLNITSPVTWGSFLLSLYPINCIIYGYFMYTSDALLRKAEKSSAEATMMSAGDALLRRSAAGLENTASDLQERGLYYARLTRIFGLVGIPLALSVHGYTGFILALSKARALWNTALMPLLFLVSAMVSGIAMMMIVVYIRDRFFVREEDVDKDLLFDLGTILVATIAFDLFLILSDILILLTADSEAHAAALLILTLDFSFAFIGVELILGSLVPVILLLVPPMRGKRWAAALAGLLVMIGIMAMRYVMVLGGQSVPLS
jgi:formate-dependent nitrite reductase membrane component NrfD